MKVEISGQGFRKSHFDRLGEVLGKRLFRLHQ